MDHVQQFMIHVYLAVLNGLKPPNYWVALATLTIPFAFLVLQPSERHFTLFFMVSALTVSISRKGPAQKEQDVFCIMQNSALASFSLIQNNVLVLPDVPLPLRFLTPRVPRVRGISLGSTAKR